MKTKIAVLFILCCCGEIFSQGFNLYSDFPSGNVIIDKVKNDTVWLRPDLRDTKMDWFYWCFAVNNAKGKTLTFKMSRWGLYSAKGPAISYDSGSTWQWLNPKLTPGYSFSYTFNTNDEVRFSMGMPYTNIQFQQFIEPYLNSDYLSLDTLTKTQSGTNIDRLTIKPIDNNTKHKVIITARHHACEMMPNYIIEGLVEEILNDDWLKNNVEFCIIPFIDIDGVENGDQGKGRAPHDHNRDYISEPIYNSTIALYNWLPNWAEGKLAIGLDLHCPGLRGAGGEKIFIVGSHIPEMEVKQLQFCDMLRTENHGELKVSEENMFYPSGTGWNKGGYVSFTRWSASVGANLGITIEFPYGSNNGQTVTQDNTRAFGKDLAQAVKKYLKQL